MKRAYWLINMICHVPKLGPPTFIIFDLLISEIISYFIESFIWFCLSKKNDQKLRFFWELKLKKNFETVCRRKLFTSWVLNPSLSSLFGVSWLIIHQSNIRFLQCFSPLTWWCGNRTRGLQIEEDRSPRWATMTTRPSPLENNASETQIGMF